MIMVASLKNFSESLKEDDEDVRIEKGDETFEPTQVPLVFEEGGQATQDELLEINFGSDEDPRPTSISRSMSLKEKDI